MTINKDKTIQQLVHLLYLVVGGGLTYAVAGGAPNPTPIVQELARIRQEFSRFSDRYEEDQKENRERDDSFKMAVNSMDIRTSRLEDWKESAGGRVEDHENRIRRIEYRYGPFPTVEHMP